jgi:hypothetical protein
MDEAFVLIETEVGRAEAVARGIRGLFGVERVETVRGAYDVVVRAKGPTVAHIRTEVLAPIQADPQVTRALLCPVGRSVIEPSTQPFEPEPFPVPEPEPPLVGVGFWSS